MSRDRQLLRNRIGRTARRGVEAAVAAGGAGCLQRRLRPGYKGGPEQGGTQGASTGTERPMEASEPDGSSTELSAAAALAPLRGEIVVVDLTSPFVGIGRLERVAGPFLVLREADLHDLRDTQSSREHYVLDARRLGPSVNRVEVWIRLAEVAAVARLRDVPRFD